MSIKPQYETYRYTSEVARLKSQSIVECRLPGSEVGSILAVQASACPNECVCADGEVRYSGKLTLCIVYEDGNRKVCRAERGAEFFHKSEGRAVSPACFAKAAFSVDNVSYRREGSGLYISVIVGADIHVYGGKQMEYLVGGENVIAKKEPLTLRRSVCVSGETEAEDEFETDYVGDILMHGENAVVTRVSVSAGQIDIEGELNLHVCVLKENDAVCTYERIIPLRLQIPCEEAFGNVTASARICVKSAQLNAGVDEEKGKSKIVFSYALSADCFLYASDELMVASDAFSTQAQLQLKKLNDGGRYLTSLVKCSERVSGVAALSPDVESDCALAASVLPRAEISCRKTENGNFEAEGILTAEVLLKSAESGHRSCTLSLPFAFPISVRAESVEADCIVCGLNVRRNRAGETEAEATLKICLRTYEKGEWGYILEAVENEPIEVSEAAISVFALGAGEGLWEAAKRLACDPEELQKSNPELAFPVKAGERIFVYRQIK